MKAQNEARQKENALYIIKSMDDALEHNRKVGFVLGQRSVIVLPQQIVTIRDEEFQLILEKERNHG